MKKHTLLRLSSTTTPGLMMMIMFGMILYAALQDRPDVAVSFPSFCVALAPSCGKTVHQLHSTTTTTTAVGGGSAPHSSPTATTIVSRRYAFERSLSAVLTAAAAFVPATAAHAAAVDNEGGLPAPTSDDAAAAVAAVPVEVTPSSPDARRLFNEGRALESQGNMPAAQRLYGRVTTISPRFIYGWSNLGNTQVALGDLSSAEENYSTAIGLCREALADDEKQGFGIRKCNDLYVLLLNRGTVRLNGGGATTTMSPRDALADLQQAAVLREKPDAVVLQNLARAKELNGMYGPADRDYSVAIGMTANEVSPFWLRAAMVKLQLGDARGGLDLLKRVENRFPDAPEVKAASATFLAELGRQEDAQRKFLEIPNRQRLRYVDRAYLTKVIAWPPAMIDGVTKIARAVGDSPQ